MFWDNVAGVYDVFVNVINRETHQKLKKIVSSLIEPGDTVLECACGTGLLIIPTYMNKDDKGKTNGYPDVEASLANGRIPCAVAVMRKK